MAKSFMGITFLKTAEYEDLLEQNKKASDYENIRKHANQLEDSLGNIKLSLQQEVSQKKMAVKEMGEYSQLADSYLDDQKKTEAKYCEITRILSEAIENGTRLSKIENIVITKDILPPVCDTPYKEKVKYNASHHEIRGAKQFIEKVAEIPYVTKVSQIGQIRKIRKNRLKKSKDNGHLAFDAVFTDKKSGSKIKILTTAKTPLQQDFLYQLLKREFEFH